jgi:hypothetical protein
METRKAAHGKRMPGDLLAMRYLSRTRPHPGGDMSRKDAVLLASRALALLFTVSALGEVSYLPEFLHSFLHYLNREPTATQYSQHYYLIRLSFLVTRIIGFSLIARWLYRGGPEIEELLLPSAAEENSTLI